MENKSDCGEEHFKIGTSGVKIQYENDPAF